MVTNEEHVYPILQLSRKRSKRVYFAMLHYIAYNLAMNTNHKHTNCKSLCKEVGTLTLLIFLIKYNEKIYIKTVMEKMDTRGFGW